MSASTTSIKSSSPDFEPRAYSATLAADFPVAYRSLSPRLHGDAQFAGGGRVHAAEPRPSPERKNTSSSHLRRSANPVRGGMPALDWVWREIPSAFELPSASSARPPCADGNEIPALDWWGPGRDLLGVYLREVGRNWKRRSAMLADKRHSMILGIVNDEGSATVGDLAERIGISEVLVPSAGTWPSSPTPASSTRCTAAPWRSTPRTSSTTCPWPSATAKNVAQERRHRPGRRAPGGPAGLCLPGRRLLR